MRFFKLLCMLSVISVVVWAVLFCIENGKADFVKVNNTGEEAADEIPEQKPSLQGVWLSYTEIGDLVQGNSAEQYREKITEMMEKFSVTGINTVFYHGRAFCDSLYYSDIFPASKNLSQEAVSGLSYDPLEELLNISKQYGIRVHLWLNPYRVSYNSDLKKIPDNSPAKKLYEQNRATLIICDMGIFLNPACSEARSLVLAGIREALDKYELDGVHFDDYFYPSAEELGDGEMYKQYKKQGGRLTLAQWRRENVNSLVSSVYALVKSYSQAMIFSISPAADIEKCTDVFYADVRKWATAEGYVDYLIPQIYFGFENSTAPFNDVVREWERLASGGCVRLACGLGAYKCGSKDENAGRGASEWIENRDILARQYEALQKSGSWQGFVLFSYSYCYGDNVNENSNMEIKNLENMIK